MSTPLMTESYTYHRDTSRPIRILVIDDSPETRHHYVTLFSRAMFDVRSMVNCESAETYLNNPNLPEEDTPDVIVTDNVMLSGNLDGITFARKFRKEYPIIIFSYDEDALANLREEGFITVDKIEEDATIFSKINRAIHDHQLFKTTMKNERDIVCILDKVDMMDQQIKDNHTELKELICNKSATTDSTWKKIVEFVKSPNFASFSTIMTSFLSLLKWIVIILFIFGLIVLGSNKKFQGSLEKLIPVIVKVTKAK